MINAHHRQVTIALNKAKFIDFRYQNTSGKWRRAYHHCAEYEETAESSTTLPLYVRTSEKRKLKPMYLALVPSRRFPEIRTYVGFHGITQLNAYIKQEGFDFEFTGGYKEQDISLKRGAKILKFLPCEVFRVLETNEWAYTLFTMKEQDVGQKTVHGFHNQSAAIAALRREVSALKALHGLKIGWGDAKPLEERTEQAQEQK